MRWLVVAVVGLSVLVAARSAPPSAATSPAGEVEVVKLSLVDAGRATPAIGSDAGADERELPTTVYLPALGEPAPLVVLAHGFDGHPRKFTDLATYWANAGYVVAVPRFPVTHDEFAVTDSSAFGDRIADLPEQARDVTFIIDEVLAASDDDDGELAGRIDVERVGLYGLSLGSLTVWTAVLGDGFGEDRVDALIQSDGAFPGDPARLDDVTFPVLVAHSDVDTTFSATDVVMPEFAALPAPKFMLVLHDALHAAVGENTPTPADEAYRVASTVFWDRYLGGKPDKPFPASIAVDGVTTFIDAS
jgi:dienelactone hydrolase